MTYFILLRKFLVCMSPISSPISVPFIISSPQSDIPLHTSLLNIGSYMVGDIFNSLLLFPIYSIEDFKIKVLWLYFLHG